MTTALLIVESAPVSADVLEEYHRWHELVHIPEMLAVEGIVAARRWEAAADSGFLTVYELDVDAETAKANLQAALKSGEMSKPVGVRTDPPPTMRYFTQVRESGE
ncbi:hypothetical protein [Nocardia callitridis]|uniref:Cyclase n=1 Tax=Nocardia callitridis TaxID=648753 RepID=A0ABP9KLE2_9NOCA